MKPTFCIDSTQTPDGGRLDLYRHDEDWYIQSGQLILMSSRSHSCEDELGRLACQGFKPDDEPRVLLGGLGLGFTLRAALSHLPRGAKLTVVELLPDVVRWNKEHFTALTGQTLDDPRVRLVVDDVHQLIRDSSEPWDVIILDVDNGPDAFTDRRNQRLYTMSDCRRLAAALPPRGRLAVWSCAHDPRYVKRLEGAGFRVETHELRAHRGKGSLQIVWLGIRHRRLPEAPPRTRRSQPIN